MIEFLGIGIGIGVFAAEHCSAAQSSQELIDQTRGEQTHDREEEECSGQMVDVAVTTRGDQTHDGKEEERSGQMVDVALINPNGDGSATLTAWP